MWRVWWLVMAVVVLGCDRAAPTTRSEAPAEVRIGYFANVTHGQAVLGVDGGGFATAVAPAKVTARVFNAGPSLIEAMLAGELDIGYVGPGPATAGWVASRGTGLVVVAGSAGNGVVIVARPGSGIRTLADLKGRRLATPQLGNTQDIAARHYVTKVLGGSADAVIGVPNAEQAGLMARGQIDAAWVPEPWGERLVKEAGAQIIGQEKDLWDGGRFALTVVIVRPEFLRDHRPTVVAILREHTRLTAQLSAGEGGARLDAALAKLTGKSLGADMIGASMGRVLFTTDPLPATFDVMAGWAWELGFAKKQPPTGGMGAMFDLSALTEAGK